MIRKIIEINEERCDGCGLCAVACHEGAIAIIGGKARLVKDEYCDGLGDCLPACPADAISFVEREASEYNQEMVNSHLSESKLSQWPVQIKLVPLRAPYFNNADLLIAADCTVFAYNGFHKDFISGRVTLVGCPKLDATDYSEKLGEIFKHNEIRSITLVKMEVPCCNGLLIALNKAVAYSGKNIPVKTFTISIKGEII